MRMFLLAGAVLFLSGCNSSSRKDPVQAMDDTARMHDPNHIVHISTTHLTAADIPSAVSMKGQVLEVYGWNDNLGENILVTSYEAPYDDRDTRYDEDGQTAQLHAYHFVKNGVAYQRMWDYNDSIKTCPFDITLNFIPGSTTVTDMNKNGIAETKLQYASACRSDVSPAGMTLVLQEGIKRYILRGNRWIAAIPGMRFDLADSNLNLSALPVSGPEDPESPRNFGRYENENDFASAPASFLFYARKEWLKYVKENTGE